MIRHYLGMALARFVAAPVTGLAAVLTFALGLLAVVAVSGVVTYWRSSDAQIAPLDRAVIFTSSAEMGDVKMGAWPKTTPALAKYLREDIPELKTVARFRPYGDVEASTGDHSLVLQGSAVDPAFLDIFKLTFIEGDARTSLQRLDAVVLVKSAAERLFGAESAVGRPLVLAGQYNVIVTGVIADLPQPSHFTSEGMYSARFEYLSPMQPDQGTENWGNMQVETYALLPEDGSLGREQLTARLAQLVDKRTPPEVKAEMNITIGVAGIEQVTEIVMNALLFGISGGILSVVAIFSGLGLIVLAVACVNYANLQTAQIIGRAQEIGMRRILGAGTFSILVQSWLEAGLAVLLALGLAAGAVWFAAPVIAAQTGIDIVGALLRDPAVLGQIAGAAALLAVIAGLYPAFVVSRLRPNEAQRTGKRRSGSRSAVRVMVGIQFAGASALLIAMLIVNQQNAYLRSTALNPGADPVIVLQAQSRTGVSLETLRQQLARYPAIKTVSETRDMPWQPGESISFMGRTPETARSAPKVNGRQVGFGYFDIHGQKTLAGRVHSSDRDPSSTNRYDKIVIDDVYARQLGFSGPQAAVGERIFEDDGDAWEIIGVVEGRPYDIQSDADGGAVYRLVTGNAGAYPLIRLSAGDVEGGLAALKRVWAELAPSVALDYKFEDQLFEQTFSTFERVGRLFLALSSLAFLISSIGLFGMAVHVTQRRRHEIGVRKTLGSSVARVVGLLLADFSIPVIIANVLVWPVAWLGAQIYLNPFVNRIDIGALPFVISLGITLVVAWAAVSAQTIRAATVQPATVLRRA